LLLAWPLVLLPALHLLPVPLLLPLLALHPPQEDALLHVLPPLLALLLLPLLVLPLLLAWHPLPPPLPVLKYLA
jgi:hypothetical protein